MVDVDVGFKSGDWHAWPDLPVPIEKRIYLEVLPTATFGDLSVATKQGADPGKSSSVQADLTSTNSYLYLPFFPAEVRISGAAKKLRGKQQGRGTEGFMGSGPFKIDFSIVLDDVFGELTELWDDSFYKPYFLWFHAPPGKGVTNVTRKPEGPVEQILDFLRRCADMVYVTYSDNAKVGQQVVLLLMLGQTFSMVCYLESMTVNHKSWSKGVQTGAVVGLSFQEVERTLDSRKSRITVPTPKLTVEQELEIEDLAIQRKLRAELEILKQGREERKKAKSFYGISYSSAQLERFQARIRALENLLSLGSTARRNLLTDKDIRIQAGLEASK